MTKLKVITLITIALTFCLVALGGLVHNTGSSLACPDWPLCFGQIMPPMEGAVAIEHSHRLLATLVGIFCLIQGWLAWSYRQSQPWIWRLALLAIGLVVFQGVLGGITVLLRLSPLVSTAHLGTSQIFLATLLVFWWIQKENPRPSPHRWKLYIAAGWLFFQMLLGAFIRHGGASGACGLGPDHLWLCWDSELGRNLFIPDNGPAVAHILHRYNGYLTLCVIIWATWALRTKPMLKKMVWALWCTLAVQILIGLWTVATYIGTVAVTLHLIGAMSAWIFLLSLVFSCGRIWESSKINAT